MLARLVFDGRTGFQPHHRSIAVGVFYGDYLRAVGRGDAGDVGSMRRLCHRGAHSVDGALCHH